MSSTPRAPGPKTKSLPPPTASEAAFERALGALDGPVAPAPSARSAPSASSDDDDWHASLDAAFAKSDEYARDRYASIGEATAFHTKVVGVTFEGRQDALAGLRDGDELRLVREPENAYDANAVAVRFGAMPVGYLARGMAQHLALQIDAGASYRCTVASISGGGERHRGLNVYVERIGEAFVQTPGAQRDHAWAGDRERVREALIGEHLPHPAQLQALSRIDAGERTLLLLGTGRGKSFCFQYPAALRALEHAQKTLVIYPLRALANDQYEALKRKLDPLGLRIHRANGAIGRSERDELFAALRDGTWDMILATPEFVSYHQDAFAAASRPTLLVIDEAHHLFESRHRVAYARFAETLAALGSPQVLALTATLRDDAFAHVVKELDIQRWVIDPTVRENLDIVDARNTKDKLAYLRALFAGGEKGIVYVNSRTEASKIAQGLRKALGDVAMFYHGGMPTALRAMVEEHFRSGDLRVVVATSAFGEGIDLPDVRRVVLYHLNFDVTEFNQQAGRAGRDGEPAWIHLLYGTKDRALNDFIIDREAPRLETLRAIYRGLRSLAREGLIVGSGADLLAALDLDRVDVRTLETAVRIFIDEGLLQSMESDEGRGLRLMPVAEKIDLTANERYAEGEAIREAFGRYCELALATDAPTLRRLIDRPIYPQQTPLLR